MSMQRPGYLPGVFYGRIGNHATEMAEAEEDPDDAG